MVKLRDIILPLSPSMRFVKFAFLTSLPVGRQA